MNKLHFLKPASAWIVLVSILWIAAGSSQQIRYPATEKGNQVDAYFGVQVPDPYRWLEDDNSPATAKWVEEENKVTFGYLENIPFRSKVKERMEQLYNYPKYSAPFRKG